MPKVLRIINRFNLGGPTYNAAYLTKYLHPEFETLLIGGLKDDSEESSEFILKNLGVDYHVIPEMRRSINLINDRIAYQKIKKIIKDFRPDIVHTHAAKAGALGRKAAFSCNVPVTVHTFHGHVFHSYFGSLQTFLVKRIERNLAKKTSAIIAISQKQKNELVEEHRIVVEEKVHVIPLGFDFERFQLGQDEKRKNFRTKYRLIDEIAVGIVGRLVPVKNHVLFLEAIKFVKENSKNKIKAFIVGDGEERKLLEQKALEMKLTGEVIFTSWEKKVENIYSGLDIVCLTSFNEGTPVSLLEAQAAGKPIVSTKVGGIEDAVINNVTALLADFTDKSQYFQNLLLLVENETKREEMSKNGWDFVKSKFSYQRLVADTSALYLQLLK